MTDLERTINANAMHQLVADRNHWRRMAERAVAGFLLAVAFGLLGWLVAITEVLR